MIDGRKLAKGVVGEVGRLYYEYNVKLYIE
jgi:hypothetical protein